ncbi:MAG: M48 family metallopeptidase [Clostridia bacterium]|nr:M48 family metallopeptidase [Clostridia bacterium]
MKNTSKVIEFPLTTTTKTNVIITKKRMKNMRLTISKTGKVAVSIPYQTTYGYAYEFLVRKRSWIASQLSKINCNLNKDSCKFVDNGNIFVLGQNFPLKLELSTKNKVIFDNGFTIYTKDLSEDFVRQQFIKWCKKYFLDFFTNRLKYIYLQMFKDNNYPIIKIKTMKSMWGNCNFVKRVASLNIYLSKARIECIDYVITHELAHLIHHNHSKDFHNLMTTLMPDWKVRKKMLKDYSLQF